MRIVRSLVVKLSTGFIAGAILFSAVSQTALAANDAGAGGSLSSQGYDTGSPPLAGPWGDPLKRDDGKHRSSPTSPLQTGGVAWGHIPSGPGLGPGVGLHPEP